MGMAIRLPSFALIAISAAVAGLLVLATGVSTDVWRGHDSLAMSIASVLWWLAVVTGIASIWQRQLWIVGVGAALVSAFFIAATTIGLEI
jgi:hypothetical protein